MMVCSVCVVYPIVWAAPSATLGRALQCQGPGGGSTTWWVQETGRLTTRLAGARPDVWAMVGLNSNNINKDGERGVSWCVGSWERRRTRKKKKKTEGIEETCVAPSPIGGEAQARRICEVPTERRQTDASRLANLDLPASGVEMEGGGRPTDGGHEERESRARVPMLQRLERYTARARMTSGIVTRHLACFRKPCRDRRRAKLQKPAETDGSVEAGAGQRPRAGGRRA